MENMHLILMGRIVLVQLVDQVVVEVDMMLVQVVVVLVELMDMMVVLVMRLVPNNVVVVVVVLLALVIKVTHLELVVMEEQHSQVQLQDHQY